MEKSPDAFRTISEVAEWLDIPTHVLRFWESRFSQIKPVKRAGGRRYYRPSDMRLIGGVKVLLHDQGMTIRSVQKTLRESGIKHVSTYSPPLDGEAPGDGGELIEGTVVEAVDLEPAAPAPAARGTHVATPDPIEEPVKDVADEDPVAAMDDAPDDDDLIDLMADDDEDEQEPAKPVEEPVAAEADTEDAAEDAPVMFRRSSTRQVDTSEPSPEPSPTDLASAQEEEPAPEPILPKIPATPGVPETDPADDDPDYAAETSIAARLIVLPPSAWTANPEMLAGARRSLAELRDRLG